MEEKNEEEKARLLLEANKRNLARVLLVVSFYAFIFFLLDALDPYQRDDFFLKKENGVFCLPFDYENGTLLKFELINHSEKKVVWKEWNGERCFNFSAEEVKCDNGTRYELSFSLPLIGNFYLRGNFVLFFIYYILTSIFLEKILRNLKK